MPFSEDIRFYCPDGVVSGGGIWYNMLIYYGNTAQCRLRRLAEISLEIALAELCGAAYDFAQEGVTGDAGISCGE